MFISLLIAFVLFLIVYQTFKGALAVWAKWQKESSGSLIKKWEDRLDKWADVASHPEPSIESIDTVSIDAVGDQREKSKPAPANHKKVYSSKNEEKMKVERFSDHASPRSKGYQLPTDCSRKREVLREGFVLKTILERKYE